MFSLGRSRGRMIEIDFEERRNTVFNGSFDGKGDCWSIDIKIAQQESNGA